MWKEPCLLTKHQDDYDFPDVVLHLLPVNKSVSEVWSDLHSTEVRGENKTQWLAVWGSQSQRQSLFILSTYKSHFVVEASHDGGCSSSDDEGWFWRLSDCNLELLGAFWMDTLWLCIEHFIPYYHTQCARPAFSPKWHTMRGEITSVKPMRNQISVLSFMGEKNPGFTAVLVQGATNNE